MEGVHTWVWALERQGAWGDGVEALQVWGPQTSARLMQGERS